MSHLRLHPKANALGPDRSSRLRRKAVGQRGLHCPLVVVTHEAGVARACPRSVVSREGWAAWLAGIPSHSLLVQVPSASALPISTGLLHTR